MAEEGPCIVNQHFPEYCQALLEQLNVQKYYSAFCDVVVRVEDVDFRLHKCVLAGASSKLQAMLYNMRQECGNVLSLEEITLNGFRIVMDFMYTGLLKMDSSFIQDVLATAQYLEIHELEKTCLEIFKLSHMGAACNSNSQQHVKSINYSSNAGTIEASQAAPLPVLSTVTSQSLVELSSQALPPVAAPPPTPGAESQVVTSSPVTPSDTLPSPVLSASLQLSIPQPTVTSTLAYSIPMTSMSVDTNYIEDYLKLIESLQGDPATYTQQGLLTKQSHIHLESPLSLAGQDSQSLERNAGSIPAVSFPTQAYSSCIPSTIGDKPSANQKLPQSGHLSKTQLSQSSASSLQTQSRFALAPSQLANMYSAEEVRRTILNVLSQEKFEDSDETVSDKGQLKNNELPITALLNLGQPSKNNKTASIEHSNENRNNVQSSDPEHSEEYREDEEDEEIPELSDQEHKEYNNPTDTVDTKSLKLSIHNVKVEPCTADYTEKAKQKRKKKTPMRLDRRVLQEGTCSDNEGRANSVEKTKAKRKKPKINKLQEVECDLIDTDYLSVDDDSLSKPLKKRLSITLKKRNECPRCGREFYKPESLQKHMAMHEKKPMHSCHVCCQKFARSCELTRHLRTHSDEIYKCDICSVEYQESSTYRQHMVLVHHDMKPFLCPYAGCSFRSAKLSNVEKHAVIHSDIKTYQCIHCGKTFAQANGLRSHVRSCLEQRAYLCDICGQKFNHLQSMKNHRRLHTGEKPYQCHNCAAKFTDHRNFKRHLRIHENIFPYPCSVCDKKFRHSNSLKAHVQTHLKQVGDEALIPV